ncbi:uncharacterized protein LOC142350014 [Convolutriloba macropyga]|uniref:uncharacterized protein LOC142350014 n=1 Tax=Convolutriloba macropyga TaxID=536237 RepID=UPI003F5289D4
MWIFLFIKIEIVVSSDLSVTPHAKRYTPFNDIRPRSKLQGSLIGTKFPVYERERCAAICSINPRCLSYNFCSDRICELNNQDVHTITTLNGSRFLIHDNLCIYGGMKNESKPSCVEQIADSEINSAGKCQISLKLLSSVNSEPSNGISNDGGTVESFETTSRTQSTPETVAGNTSKMTLVTSQQSTSTTGTELTMSYVERGVPADDDDEDADGGGGAVDWSTMEDAMEVNTLNEWKLVTKCTACSFPLDSSCPIFYTKEWYRWPYGRSDQYSYEEATFKCSDIGGYLFPFLNGSEGLLQFICKDTEAQFVWLDLSYRYGAWYETYSYTIIDSFLQDLWVAAPYLDDDDNRVMIDCFEWRLGRDEIFLETAQDGANAAVLCGIYY